MTFLDVAKAALKRIGVLADGAVPTASQGEDARLRANSLLDMWATEKMLLYALTRTETAIVASQASYTVGSGGNINVVRPVYIDRLGLIETAVTPEFERPLKLLNDREFEALAVKDLTSTEPVAAYYNPTYPLGTLIPYPIPTSTTLKWATYIWAQVSEFAAVSTSFDLPPGWRQLIETNLAQELCQDYGVLPSPDLVKAATKAMAAVKRSNYRAIELSVDPGALGSSARRGGYDIRTGG